MTIADRNRAIKKLLYEAFGRGKVTVRGHRGTAFGWLTVNIAYAPKNRDERETLTKKIWDLFRATGIDKQIGTYGYNDPGSDYGYGSKIHINFEPCIESEWR